jgi:hypothetical protein
MAGMMRDRIVQSEMKPPTKTVAQEVLPADSMGMEGFSDPTAGTATCYAEGWWTYSYTCS